MIKFSKIYLVLFIAIFLIEIIIAKYATGFLRHTIGDYLAVIFVYTFIKSFFKISIEKAVLITFAISFIIEFLQLSDLKNYFPKEYSQTFKIVFGTSFSIGDLVAYTLGIVTIVLVEEYLRRSKIAF